MARVQEKVVNSVVNYFLRKTLPDIFCMFLGLFSQGFIILQKVHSSPPCLSNNWLRHGEECTFCRMIDPRRGAKLQSHNFGFSWTLAARCIFFTNLPAIRFVFLINVVKKIDNNTNLWLSLWRELSYWNSYYKQTTIDTLLILMNNSWGG